MNLSDRQAFIGVGTMGSLMARCLLDAGVDLTVPTSAMRLRTAYQQGQVG